MIFLAMPKHAQRSNEEIALDRKIGITLAFIRNREASQTQEEFGKGFGMSQSRLANIESGRTPLPAFVGWDICDTFNVHPTWLCKGGEYPESRMPDIPPKVREAIEESFKTLASSPFRNVWPALVWAFKETVSDEISSPRDIKINVDGKPMVDTGKESGKVLSVSSEKIPTWKELVSKLKGLTQAPGAKAKLASDLKTSRQNVNKWLSGSGMPSAELTLAVLRWVQENG